MKDSLRLNVALLEKLIEEEKEGEKEEKEEEQPDKKTGASRKGKIRAKTSRKK